MNENDIIINDCSSVATKHNSTDIKSPFSSKRSSYNIQLRLRNTIFFSILFWWLYLSRQKYCRNMFILLLGLLSLNDTLRAKCTYSYTGYLSSLLSSLFCDVLSNNINNIEKLHQRIFFFFPKCVQLLIFHTMSSTNKVFPLFWFR